MLKFACSVCIPLSHVERVFDFLLAVFLCKSNQDLIKSISDQNIKSHFLTSNRMSISHFIFHMSNSPLWIPFSNIRFSSLQFSFFLNSGSPPIVSSAQVEQFTSFWTEFRSGMLNSRFPVPGLSSHLLML